MPRPTPPAKPRPAAPATGAAPGGRVGPATVVGLVALAVLVGPGFVERALGGPDDEALRLPLAAAAVAAVLLAGRRGPGLSRGAWLGAGLALAAALLPLLAPRLADGATPLPRPLPFSLGLLGPTALGLLGAGALVVGARLALAGRAVLVAGLGAAGAVAAAWAIADRLAGGPGIGPFGRPGVAGPALAALAGAIVAAAARLGSAARLAGALLAVGGVVATGSRTGVAALGLAAVVVAARHARRHGPALALGAVAAGAAAVVALAAGVRPPGLGDRGTTVDVRMGVARAAVALVAERPLVGHGPFGFPASVLRVRDLDEARRSGTARPLAAHGDVLSAAVAGGVGAGLAVAALACLAVAAAWRRARPGTPGVDAAASAALLATVALATASLAEDPRLSTVTAPVAGLAAGLALARAPAGGAPSPAGRGARAGRATAATAGLLAAGLASAAADHVEALRIADTPAALEHGTFLATEGLRARGYRVAVAAAEAGRYGVARDRFAALLRWDPGATEARLDTAETYRLEGRRSDAEATLLAAAHADPTRFDVPHRRGHLALGDEPPPSARVPLEAPLAALRAYNEAATLHPGRFETQVAYARVHRRRGDLKAADAALEAAAKAAAARGQGTPGELLLELARLAEAVGAPLPDRVRAFTLGLAADRGAAAGLAAEALAAVAAADGTTARAEAARARAGEAEGKRLDALAEADREAAAVRWSALVGAGALAPAALRAGAREAVAAGRAQEAVVRYRVLLADPFAALDVDLALEARAAAAPVDRARAEAWGARARTALGLRALGAGDLSGAERELDAALAHDPGDVLALYARARLLVATGRRDEAVRELTRAVRADPTVLDAARATPDLGPLVPDVTPPAPR